MIGAGKRFHFKVRRAMDGRMNWRFAGLALVVATVVSHAQEAEKPSALLINEAESAVVSDPGLDLAQEPLPAMDIPTPENDNIFGEPLYAPEDVMTGPRAPVIPAPLPSLEDPFEKERKQKIRLRQIRARLQSDPRLEELRVMAERAPTPEDYRAARRAWYTLFFDRVRAADGTLKDLADKLEKQSLAGLYQTRIEPTWPLEPAPQPQPQARFVPPREFPDLPADEEPVRFSVPAER
jgi:hypothetical protein